MKRENSATTSSLNNIRRVTDPRKVYKMIRELFRNDIDILPFAEKMDIGRNINIYNLLTLEKDNLFLKLRREVRDYIKLKYRNVKDNRFIDKKMRYMILFISLNTF